MTGPKWVTLLGVASLSLLALGVGQAAAQTAAVITGRVTSERGDPLPAASVRVGTTNFGASATSTGTYSITVDAAAVRGQEVTLTAQAIGYRPVSRVVTLRAGSQEQNFSLKPDPFRLDELISTGVAAATSARKLPFAVGKVGAEELQEVPGSNALVALQGKVAGLRVVPNSGQPGGEVSLRLRGATSISGRQDPLFIVDGVITQFGLADIAAEDVERIEVIKGAAASSLYGSNAANGVVQVFTKRGRSLPDGTLQVTSRFEGGVNQMPKRLEFSRSHPYQVDANGDYVLNATGNRIVELDQVSDNPFKVYHDHWDQLVDPGQFWTGYFSVGQRRGATNFNASFQHTDNDGVIFGLGGYNRQNFRMNLDQQLASNIDASFSMFFGRSSNGRAAEGQTGPFYGLMFLQPDVDILAPNPDGSPYKAQVPLSGDVANDFNPLYELANRKITRDRNRFSGSSRARWQMTDWLSAEGSFAFDQAAQDDADVTPFGYLTSSGTKTEGSLLKEQRNDRQYNAGATLSATRTFGKVTNTTKVSATFEDQKNRYLSSSANRLIVERVPEFGGSDPSAQRAASREEHIRNRNFFAITTFDINDRYILDGLIRRDGSSLFGPQSRWTTYFRVSGAWRANEDLQIKGIDELRFRASYGTAGLRPEFDDQFEILEVTPGGFTKETLGNPLLKPARSAELELGANLEFGGGRVALEYTYASKKTRDQILLVDLPAVVGFKQQWQNTGKLEAKTHEVALSAQLINTRSTAWTVRIVGDRTRQVITEWNLPERLYSFEQMPAAFFLGNGSSLGVLYGQRWITDINDLYDDPAKAAASGAGQAFDPNNFEINSDGYVVLKSLHHTPDERPIAYVFCKRQDAAGDCAETTNVSRIGDANPDFNLSFGTTINFKRFVINGLLDWSQGGDLYNGTR